MSVDMSLQPILGLAVIAQFFEQAQATAVQASFHHVQIQAQDFGDFFGNKILHLVEAHLCAAKALQPGSPVCGQAYFITDHPPVNFF